jgi:hypothetical protein
MLLILLLGTLGAGVFAQLRDVRGRSVARKARVPCAEFGAHHFRNRDRGAGHETGASFA